MSLLLFREVCYCLSMNQFVIQSMNECNCLLFSMNFVTVYRMNEFVTVQSMNEFVTVQSLNEFVTVQSMNEFVSLVQECL